MTVGLGQVVLILVVIFLFFGNLSSILKDLVDSFRTFKKVWKDKSKD